MQLLVELAHQPVCHCYQVEYKPREIERNAAPAMGGFFGFARNVYTFEHPMQNRHGTP